jgi:hypothetical protein
MPFDSPKKWMSWIASTEWWYNTNYHTSLTMTPFQALYGFPPAEVNEVVLHDDANEKATCLLQRRQLANELIKDNLNKA